MEALAVTIFCSVLLAGFFVVMFLGSQRGRRLGEEQEALLPLDDGERLPIPVPAPHPAANPQPTSTNPSQHLS